MRLFSFAIRVLCGGVLLLAMPAWAAPNQYGDIIVRLTTPPNIDHTHGYDEFKVTVVNLSGQDRHRVKLTLPQHAYYGGSATRTIEVEPGSTARVSMFTSIMMGGNGMEVEIDGRTQREVVPADLGIARADARPAVLISQGAAGKSFHSIAGGVLKDSSGKETFLPVRAETPVVEWSANWLGYSGYDAVVATADEMRSVPEDVAGALVRYAECGGVLLVIGSWSVPQTWRDQQQNDGSLSMYPAGFGICIVVKDGLIQKLDKTSWEHVAESWQDSKSPWDSRGSFEFASANRRFPVTDNVSIPVRGLLLIIVAFVILIGPLNLFILSRKKKRMWLLWTVPAISLLTCLTVSAYSLLSEGWGGKARYLSFTVLDERSHRASTVGLNAFYMPLTPGGGLHFSTDTELTGKGAGYPYGSDNVQMRLVDWSQDQHLEEGWITARTPAHLMVRRSETRRERLTVTQATDESLSVVNGLGVAVRNLWLVDEKGRSFIGVDIPAGASATLRPNTGWVANPPVPLRKALVGDWIDLVQSRATYLRLIRSGTYIAELDACPFLEEGISGVKEKKVEALVYGIMRRPGDED